MTPALTLYSVTCSAAPTHEPRMYGRSAYYILTQYIS